MIMRVSDDLSIWRNDIVIFDLYCRCVTWVIVIVMFDVNVAVAIL